MGTVANIEDGDGEAGKIEFVPTGVIEVTTALTRDLLSEDSKGQLIFTNGKLEFIIVSTDTGTARMTVDQFAEFINFVGDHKEFKL